MWLKIEPQEAGKGYEFVNGIVGGVVPREYIPAVDKGVKEALRERRHRRLPGRRRQGHALSTARTTTSTRTKWRSRSPARWRFKEGVRKAKPVLLEPIMKVEVVTPEDYTGDVIGDLNRRRGHIQGMEDGPSGKVVTAEVPLAEMFGYATSVRSMTQGRATFTMEFAKYVEVPNNVAEAVMKKAS